MAARQRRSVIDLLLEGFETALFPCSLVLLVPGVAAAVTARQESAAALIGYVTTTIVVGWLRFSGQLDDLAVPIVAMAFALAAALLVVPLIRRINLVSAAGGGVAGVAAASLWEPCVGEEFGTVLTELPDRGLVGLGLMTIYLIGVMVPLGIVGAVLHLIPNPVLLPARPFMMILGGGVFGILAIATATGFIDSVISQLVSWTLA